MSIVESLAQGIIQNLDKLVDMAVTIISSFGQFIIENLPMLIQSGLDILLELGDSITQNLPTLIPAIVDVVVEIVNTIADNADKLIEGAVTLITTLALALTEPQTLVKLIEAAIKLILALAEGLLKAIPQLLQAVPVIITNLFTALVQGVPKIAEAAVELVKAIFQTFTSIDWLGLGKDIIIGIINGIISMAGALVDTMKNLAKSALEGAKNLLGIHSPSKVFRDDVGQMIGLGMVEGIEESINPVQNAMNALSAASIGKMNASNQIKNSGYGQMQLAGAGFGDITIPVYIGSTKMGQAVASANNLNNYRSGGR
jgi:phage-related protein